MHLSLIQNEVDLFSRHRIVESNTGDTEVHRCNHSRGPLLSILGPDTDKSPQGSLAFNLRTEVELHHPSRELLANRIDLLPTLPDILAELWLAFCVIGEALTSTEKGLVGVFAHVFFEIL